MLSSSSSKLQILNFFTKNSLSVLIFYLKLTLIFCLNTDKITTIDLLNGDVFFEILDPPELEYTYRLRPAKDFGGTFNSNFRLREIPMVPIYPGDGCLLSQIVNAEEIRGHIALVERGECSFLTKAINAERLGARAVIVTESESLEDSENEFYIEMVDDESGREATIPAGFLLGKNGRIIKSTLRRLKRNYALVNLPVNLTFTPVHMINHPPWLGM